MKQFNIWLALFLLSGNLTAQDLNSLLERYSGDNAPGYIQPLVTSFGANLNTGMFRSAHIPKGGLHIDIRANGMLAFISDDQKTFKAKTQGNFLPEQEVETSTVLGAGQGAEVEGEGGVTFNFPGGYEYDIIPALAPTVTIGSLFGTEGSVRFFESKISDELGDLSFLALGVRHSISQYFTDSFDLSMGYQYTNFDIGDVLEMDAWILHAEIGRSFSILDLYSGLGIENTSADVEYDFEFSDDQVERVRVSTEGENEFRVFAGFALNLAILHINMDFHLGQQNLANVGVSIGL